MRWTERTLSILLDNKVTSSKASSQGSFTLNYEYITMDNSTEQVEVEVEASVDVNV